MSNYYEAPHNGVKTSVRAARNIEPVAGTVGAEVLGYLRDQGEQGATLEQIEHGTGIGGNTVRPRMKTLRSRGQVVDSGHTRKTASGNDAIVWVVAEAWRAVPSTKPAKPAVETPDPLILDHHLGRRWEMPRETTD